MEPTDIHVVSIGQLTELASPPTGIEVGAIQSVRSTVRNEVAPPPRPMPVVTQVVLFAQEMDLRSDTAGLSIVLQLVPSVVSTMAGFESTVPTATHVVELGHETPASESKPEGGVCAVQEPFEYVSIKEL